MDNPEPTSSILNFPFDYVEDKTNLFMMNPGVLVDSMLALEDEEMPASDCLSDIRFMSAMMNDAKEIQQRTRDIDKPLQSLHKFDMAMGNLMKFNSTKTVDNLKHNIRDLKLTLNEINVKESLDVLIGFSDEECTFIYNDPFLKTTLVFKRASHPVRLLRAPTKRQFRYLCRYIKHTTCAVKNSDIVSFTVNGEGFLCVECNISNIFANGAGRSFVYAPIKLMYLYIISDDSIE